MVLHMGYLTNLDPHPLARLILKSVFGKFNSETVITTLTCLMRSWTRLMEIIVAVPFLMRLCLRYRSNVYKTKGIRVTSSTTGLKESVKFEPEAPTYALHQR